MADLSNRLSQLTPEQRQKLIQKIRPQKSGISPRPDPKDPVLLSWAQEWMWILEQLDPGVQNNPLTLEILGELNDDVLQRCLEEIVQRHEILRTCYRIQNEVLKQYSINEVSFSLLLIDLQQNSSSKQESQARDLLAQKTQEPFDLSKEYPFRVILLKFSDNKHWLHFIWHHIACDDTSYALLVKELTYLYQVFLQGSSLKLNPLVLQYADFAYWQRQERIEASFSNSLRYWQEKLKHFPESLFLPYLPSFLLEKQKTGACKIQFSLSKDLTKKIKRFSQHYQISLFTTLFTVFNLLLYSYTHQTDIIIGIPVTLRDQIELQDLIGIFINVLALRTDLTGDPTCLELLQRVKLTVFEALDHKDLPYTKLLTILDPRHQGKLTHLFRVMFDFQSIEIPTVELPNKELSFRLIELNLQPSVLDLTLHIEESDQALRGYFKYKANLFESRVIEQMTDRWQELLQDFIKDPDRRISSVFNSKSRFKKLKCVLIGQESFLIPCAEILLQKGHFICAIVSNGRLVQNWCRIHNVLYQPDVQGLLEFFSQDPFDYLFSIYNSQIVSLEILKIASQGSINLHDSYLPDNKGLYAPSWAIFYGEKITGITWHFMKEAIDQGDILKQIPISINPNETAFTLNVKCYEAALQSFPGLIDDLVNETIQLRTQPSEGLYHTAVQRPTPGCIISWAWTSETIDSLIRALDFGVYDNPFGVAKLYTSNNFYRIKTCRISHQTSSLPPGTLVSCSETHLHLSTSSHDLIITELQSLEGNPVDLGNWIQDLNLQPGSSLPEIPSELRKAIEEKEISCLRKESFWLNRLAELDSVSLPFPKNSKGCYSQYKKVWDPSEFIQSFLSSIPTQDRQDFLLAMFVAYLSRINDCHSFDIGIGFLGIYHLDMIFSSTIPCHFDHHFEYTLDPFLQYIKEKINDTKNYQTFYRDIVTRYSALTNLRNVKIEAFFPVIIRFLLELDNYSPSDECVFEFGITEIGSCAFFYSSCYELFEIERLIQSFTIFVEEWILNSEQKLATVPIISKQDLQNLQDWNKTEVNYSYHPVHEIFSAQAKRAPHAIALIDPEQQVTLTYQDLNERSNQLALYLQQQGVQAEALVGICMDRSSELIIGMLAILKAGGAYLPLDPSYPNDRLMFMVSDAQPKLILTQKQYLPQLSITNIPTLSLDSNWFSLFPQETNSLENTHKFSDLAYVIYTSGSTGQPKGVMIEHRSLTNFVLETIKNYSLRENDRILQFASINFDSSVEEIYPALCCGATLVLRTYEMLSSSAKFWHSCQSWKITVCSLTTAYWQQITYDMISEFIPIPILLRLLIIGGERVQPKFIGLWHQYVGDRIKIFNTYGPTETTVVATAFSIPMQIDYGDRSEIPIGNPLGNVKTYILGSDQTLMPIGFPGELHIAGIGVMRGYLNRLDLTEEKFITTLFESERLYKTGDMARYLPDGNLEFLGRQDRQIKIRGFRVEPGEIEVFLTQLEMLESALIVAKKDKSEDLYLIAYVIPKPGSKIVISELKIHLKAKLPDYMIPSSFVILEAFPLTPNGKIDRRALPDPDFTQGSSHLVAPQTETEKIAASIWSEVLNRNPIGIQDNFFGLGGHSLLATQVISRIRKHLQIELSLRSLFEYPILAEWAKYVEKMACDQSNQLGSKAPDKLWEEIDI